MSKNALKLPIISEVSVGDNDQRTVRLERVIRLGEHPERDACADRILLVEGGVI